jgi:hypothetical protein
MVRLAGGNGLTLSTAVLAALPTVAVIVTDVTLDTGLVDIENVVDDVPGATLTLAGTVAADVALLDRFTETPGDGAAPERVTVP